MLWWNETILTPFKWTKHIILISLHSSEKNLTYWNILHRASEFITAYFGLLRQLQHTRCIYYSPCSINKLSTHSVSTGKIKIALIIFPYQMLCKVKHMNWITSFIFIQSSNLNVMPHSILRIKSSVWKYIYIYIYNFNSLALTNVCTGVNNR